MHCEKDDKNIYDETVDTSKELSIQKAVAIFMDNMEADKPKVKRPDINPRKGIIQIIITIGLLCILCAVSYLLNISLLYSFAVAAVIVILNIKRAIIWSILIYQKYAPERVRASCVFTPTCSEYMMTAIKKYGLVKGFIKGIKRLLRCHPPNGGTDIP